MFGKFSEQLKKSSKPINSLMAMNAKVMEDLSQNQTELFTGLLSDSVKFMESVKVQTEVKGFVAAGSEYAESMRDRLALASKEAYSTLSSMQAGYKDVLKTSLEDGVDAAKAAVEAEPKPASKAASAPAPKAKTAAKAKPASAAAPKAKPVKAAPKSSTPAAEKPVEAPAPVVEAPAPAVEAPAPAVEAKATTETAPKKTTRTRRTTTTKKAPAKSASSTKSTS